MNLHYRSDQNPGAGVAVINGDASPGVNNYTYPGTAVRLFPTSEGTFLAEIDNQTVVTQLVLPDGRALHFNYNKFGEVAEIQLHTGASIQYDYAAAALPAGNTGLQENHSQMGAVSDTDRAVITRRTYQPGSTTPEGTWTYSYGTLTPSNSTVPAPATEVTCTGSQLLLHERHFFLPSGRYISGTNTGMKGIDGTSYTLWSTGLEFRTETFDSNGTTVLAASETDWSQRTGLAWSGVYVQEQPENDNRTNEARRFLDDSSMSRVHTFYDDLGSAPRANNPTTVDEYDFDGTVKRHTETTYFGGYTDDNTHLLRLASQSSTYNTANGILFAQTTFEYDNYTSEVGTNPNHQPIQSYTSVVSHTASYDLNYLTRGNPTAVTQFVGPDSITSYPRYDILGNVVSTKDPRGNVTTVAFLDDFGTGSNPGLNSGGQSTYSLPTKITSPPPNSGESSHVAYSQYDYSTGLLTGFKDRNGMITQTIYNDAFDRPTQIKAALATTLENHTAMYYAPTSAFGVSLTNNDVLTARDQASTDDGNLRSWNHTDGFGRTIESWASDPQGNVKVATAYDGLGRAVQTSNPFRPSVPETQYNTTTAYDLLGRITTVTTADNAVVTTAYSGARVLVTDQAGKQRISRSDGLGRLTDVWEVTAADNATESLAFPGYPVISAGYRTTYGYDALDDLTLVTQKVGATPMQTRSFAYDGLKRLTQAINPESGTINYASYDGNGNLLQKTDARSITTNYSYDAFNRVTTKSYQGDTSGTPAVSYFYDAQTVPTLPAGAPTFSRGSSTGRLVAVIYGAGNAGTYQGYDQTGRVVQSIQVTETQATGSPNPQAYGFTYSYNLASQMLTEGYPSGRVVQTEYDSAGRVAGARNQGAAWYYAGGSASDTANRIQYASQGAISAMKLGNGKWVHTTFNSRLQPTQIGLGTSGTDSSILKLDYGYGTTSNNGNVLSQTITASGLTLTQCYAYDSLNRLSSAEEHSGIDCTGVQQWKQTYDCDRFGNRAVRNTSTYIPSPSLTPPSANSSDFSAFDQGMNRLNPAVMPGFSYDASGNLTSDPNTSSNGITYDAENRQTQYTRSGQATNYYYYDGDGRRVKKIDSTGTTVFVYNAGGQLIAEYTSPSGSGTSYLTSDHLGSTRVATDANGVVKARHDYLPFGEEIQGGIGGRTPGQGYVADNVRQKFTQKERDSESGLDYFLARYYSSAQGRFTSVDPGPHSLEEPQVWNRYAYTANDPLNFTDPDGEFSWGASLGGNLTDQQLRQRATNAANLGAAFQNLAIIAQRNAFRNALTEIGLARDHFAVGSQQRTLLQRGLDAYGTENDGRGPRMQVARTLRGGGDTSPNGGEVRFSANSFRAGMATGGMFEQSAQSSRVAFASAVAHEGTHVYNNTHGMYSPAFQNELSAFRAQSMVIQARDPYAGAFIVWGPQQKHLYSLYWRQDPQGLESKRTRAIVEYMRSDPLYQRLVPRRR